jgi:tetratricopeptide (TPR) repeat protein
VFPFFLGQRKEDVFNKAEKADLDRAFCSYMTVLAEQYTYLMLSKEAGKKQMGFMLFRLDRENLHKALQRVLDNEGDFYRLYNVFSLLYFQQPLYHEAIAFMEGVLNKLDRFSKKEKVFLSQYASVVGNLGSNYQQVKNFSEAKKNHKKALDLLHQAGERHETAAVYHQLGMVAEEERDFTEAKRYYREALKICQEFNDRFSQARTYHQLGWVAAEERYFAEAKRNYREALKIKQEFNDRYSQASIYHQLGIVAQEEQDFAEAKRNYREALKIKQEFNDRFTQAGTYGQMGIIAEEEKDYASSLGYYATALEIFHESSDQYNLEKTIRNLARLLQIKDWDAPAAIAQLEIKEETKKALQSLLEEVKKEE